jgi:hypothetical protein
MTNQEKIEAQMIDDVIENFDFLRCHYVMKFLNWCWVHNDNKVPTIDELKSESKKRFESAISLSKKRTRGRSNDGVVSSGGLKATAITNSHKHLTWLELEFILTDWSCDGDFESIND